MYRCILHYVFDLAVILRTIRNFKGWPQFFFWRPKFCRCSSSVLNLSCILGNRVSPPRRAKASDHHRAATVGLNAFPTQHFFGGFLCWSTLLRNHVAIVFFLKKESLLEYIDGQSTEVPFDPCGIDFDFEMWSSSTFYGPTYPAQQLLPPHVVSWNWEGEIEGGKRGTKVRGGGGEGIWREAREEGGLVSSSTFPFRFNVHPLK